MNFISKTKDQEIQVELKYCERCGGLWLRPRGTNGVHCVSCRALLESRPNPREVPPRIVRRHKAYTERGCHRKKDLRNRVRIGYLHGMAILEVSA
jgi:Zn-finger nucleic acid-binding protein